MNTGTRINLRLLSLDSTGRRAQASDAVLRRCTVSCSYQPIIVRTRADFWTRGLSPAIKERLYHLAPLVP